MGALSMATYPAKFALVETHNAPELGVRVELRGNGTAWLVLQTDTDSNYLIEARGCPSEAEAREYFGRIVEALL